MVKTKTKSKENQIRKQKTNMKKQIIKQNIPPPSPDLIRQLNAMGYIISNDFVIIKLPTKESNEVQK
jgi:hypothetical protein